MSQTVDRLSVGTEFVPPEGGRFRKATQADVDAQRLQLQALAQAERSRAVVRQSGQSPSVEEAQRALGRAKVEESREHQRIDESAKATKARSQQALDHVRAYADQVAQAVKAAAALNPNLPAPLHVRVGVRLLLHGGGTPRWGTPDVDAALDQLFQLQQRGLWLYDNLPGLDDSGRQELDQAESAAWAAVVARSKVVSGE